MNPHVTASNEASGSSRSFGVTDTHLYVGCL